LPVFGIKKSSFNFVLTSAQHWPYSVWIAQYTNARRNNSRQAWPCFRWHAHTK